MPETVWPVRIARGAFGENVPVRGLFVSSDHAIYVDGVLIPAKYLLNGTTVRQVKRRRMVYHHIELAEHDVVLAEGLPAETYLDTGDRETFSGGRVITLYPDFVGRAREMRGCAELVRDRPAVERGATTAGNSVAWTRGGCPRVLVKQSRGRRLLGRGPRCAGLNAHDAWEWLLTRAAFIRSTLNLDSRWA
jgi:hypothetical protein